jgi:hypothetical protein
MVPCYFYFRIGLSLKGVEALSLAYSFYKYEDFFGVLVFLFEKSMESVNSTFLILL